MEMFKKIILAGLQSKKLKWTLTCDKDVNLEKMFSDKSYMILLEIKKILEDDSLSDFYCIEEIMRIFRDLGGIDVRHDFG